MDFLPLFMRLQDRPVLLVGGGAVALRKARLLHRAGAHIRVVAPAVHADLAQLAGDVQERAFADGDLADVVLVIAATDDAALNERLAQQCAARRLPINVVDNPALCTVVIPTIVDRSPLVLAISSGGRAPVLARMLRARLETLIPAAYGKLADLAGAFRGEVKQRIADPERRRHFWEQVLEGPAAEMVLAGNTEGARQRLREELDSCDEQERPVGEVYLVGAGPGDPDLLTFKALRLMQKADVVLYDRLVAPEIVNLVRKDAEMIYVGKQQDQHTVPQGEINQLLVKLAREGRRVLRLKGGDPFIFGRGGEEIEELAAHHIPFQVVPGITAASGCACYSGIPLTHRDHAQSVRFVTGHLKEGSPELNWEELVNPHETVVFYMGMGALPQICQQLIAHGRSPETPIALIRKGTTTEQRVATGTLATLPGSVDQAAFRPPTLIMVGAVVQLRDKLAWFDKNGANTKT